MVLLGSIIAFLLVMMLLVSALLYAKAKLVPSGDVKILINGDESKAITTGAGSSLLTVLSNQGIFLPSACGGGGTCAMCKCHVHSGGGDLLPTEVSMLKIAGIPKIRLRLDAMSFTLSIECQKPDSLLNTHLCFFIIWG